MHKQERLQLILDLVAESPIATQAELVRALTEHGHSVTQSSVSRDIEELGLTKVGGHYARSVAVRSSLQLTSVEPVGQHLIVGKCPSGLASAVTVLIDQEKLPSIAGTIAGDDTIFIAVRNRKDQGDAMKMIRTMFEVTG